MNRDEARAWFAAAGLTYANVDKDSLQRLKELIDEKMVASGLMKGSYRCNKKLILEGRVSPSFFAGIECHAFYFDKREAVSFNRDGFIGFAGWSDDTNVQPILEGFVAWVDELKYSMVQEV